MKRAYKYFSLLLFSAALCGLLLSMAHYHSETMECLDHSATEQHFTENTALCPVTTIITDHPDCNTPEIQHTLSFVELIENTADAAVVSDLYFQHFSRPPPAIA